MKQEIFVVTLFSIIIFLIGCTSQIQEQKTSAVNLNSFAKCLTEKGVKMYGSYICSACLAQIKMFGGHDGSFKFIDYIECHPKGPNPQTDLCLKRDIKKTPTWILERDGIEIKRLEGYQIVDALSEFSGCALEYSNNER